MPPETPISLAKSSIPLCEPPLRVAPLIPALYLAAPLDAVYNTYGFAVPVLIGLGGGE